MAIGDKKPVVMQSDRAVAGGVATLGTDGKLLDAQIPGPDKLGAAPALESTAYPGCYYRMVDGVVEWINPPLSTIGQEYRTTERYEGLPVYVQIIPLTGAAQGTPAYAEKALGATSKGLVRYSATLDGWSIPTNMYGGGMPTAFDSVQVIHASARINGEGNLVCYVAAPARDLSSQTAYFTVYYTKSA